MTSYVTEAWYLSQSQITQSYDIKKDIEGFRIDNII